MRLRTLAALAAVTLLTLGLTACTSGSTAMTDRPTIEEITADYDAFAAELRDAVNAEYPDATWSEDGELETGLLGGEGEISASSQIWYAEAAVASDDEARARILAAADAAADAHGFDAFAQVSDTPGGFSYVAGDAWGGAMYWGAGDVNTTIRYSTGAHPKG